MRNESAPHIIRNKYGAICQSIQIRLIGWSLQRYNILGWANTHLFSNVNKYRETWEQVEIYGL